MRRPRHLESCQHHSGHRTGPELQALEHHLPATADLERHQGDHLIHPEITGPLHLQVMEHPLRAFPLDPLVGENHPKIMERLQIPQQHQIVTQPLRRLHQAMVHLLRPVLSVEDILHKYMAPLEELDRSEVVHLPDHQAVMELRAQVLSAVELLHPVVTLHLRQLSVLPAFLLVRYPRVTGPLQGQLLHTVFLRCFHQITADRVLHLDLSELSLKFMGLHRLHNHVGHQDQRGFPALQINFLKEVHRQGVTVYQQP